MEHYGISKRDAFLELKQLSTIDNKQLRVIARDVVDDCKKRAGRPPPRIRLIR